MGPIGIPELTVILVIVLLLFGAKKIPELARGLGKSMGEFKKAREDFERELHNAADQVAKEEKPQIRPADGRESRNSEPS